jgi:hypothetical protein
MHRYFLSAAEADAEVEAAAGAAAGGVDEVSELLEPDDDALLVSLDDFGLALP